MKNSHPVLISHPAHPFSMLLLLLLFFVLFVFAARFYVVFSAHKNEKGKNTQNWKYRKHSIKRENHKREKGWFGWMDSSLCFLQFRLLSSSYPFNVFSSLVVSLLQTIIVHNYLLSIFFSLIFHTVYEW